VNSRYQKGKDLIQIGAYAMGSDPGLDEAVRLNDGMTEFLQQGMYESSALADSVEQMRQSVGTKPSMAGRM
jgi:flagellum-specific ATP synthase